MMDTTAAPTYAVTQEIDYYGGTSRLRVLTLTDDLAEARAEAQALGDAARAPYGAMFLEHNECGKCYVVNELVGYIDYSDWTTFPCDLDDIACEIFEGRGLDPENIEDIVSAVDEAAAQLGCLIAADETDGWSTKSLLLCRLGSDLSMS